MRVTKEKAAENRERILQAAARLIRERGISGAGVDALTEAAGMTHGSLYSQFGSKERLVEEALAYALGAGGKASTGTTTLNQAIASYLAPEHRDQPGQGCAIAALVSEMPRQSESVRRTFTAGVSNMRAYVSNKMSPELKQRQRDEQALAALSAMIGALVLARAVNDPELSDEILRATRKSLSG